MVNVDSWLVFMRNVLSDMYNLQFGSYPIFQIFLAMAVVSVVSSALVIRVKRGI